ncbi:DNA-binding protein [Herbaspirillum sp. C7C8]|uniref:DNA-binding protein n=1 Tax=Herbaspirillum sp. C7C8 TaxID=2736665 RepID=UPI001F518060|nr:DNA-binding protein [Herbaspirillum sp. C7C8]MCI1007310.1 DNA-binding protein [Herbaspirillum sp. C7C8]
MARTGLYKSEVKKARDALLALGRHPSVDAVRVELGNTGSKTTIHKYLKELEEEEGGQDRPRSISDTLQDLVGRLAAQLQAEAAIQVQTVRADAEAATTRMRQELETLRAAHAEQGLRLGQTQQALIAERAAHDKTREERQEQAAVVRTLEVRLAALQERLDENEQHRQSLEEKHQHARQALEHYRSAAREQREQDQRRHEQQLQSLQAELRQLRQEAVIRQEDITRLNQEGVRLIAELSHSRQALAEQLTLAARREQQLDSLQQVASAKLVLEAQLAARNEALTQLQCRLAEAQQDVAIARQQWQQGERELAALRARLETHEALLQQWRTRTDTEPMREEEKNERIAPGAVDP